MSGPSSLTLKNYLPAFIENVILSVIYEQLKHRPLCAIIYTFPRRQLERFQITETDIDLAVGVPLTLQLSPL